MQGIQEEERETIWDNKFIGDTTNVKSDVRCRLVGKKKITKNVVTEHQACLFQHTFCFQILHLLKFKFSCKD